MNKTIIEPLLLDSQCVCTFVPNTNDQVDVRQSEKTLVNFIQPQTKTRMVQLPATAAIEYVAACCRTRSGTRTRTKTKTRTITKTVRGPYARSPQVQYV